MSDAGRLEQLEVLYEVDDLPRTDLPDELARLHGGDLGFPDTCLYANFVASVDGIVAIPHMSRSNEFIAGDSDADRFLMGLLRAFADLVLVASGVLRASPRGTWQFDKQNHTPVQQWYLRQVREDGRALSNVVLQSLA